MEKTYDNYSDEEFIDEDILGSDSIQGRFGCCVFWCFIT
jgi:hypothetical protein